MPIQLPPRSDVSGAVARLLLSEAQGPASPFYVQANTFMSMQWMKVVLNNRLNNDPAQFLAPHAKTVIDIIRAPNQFAGFRHYPNYDVDLVNRLQSYVDIANSAKDKRQQSYAIFINGAIQVANAAPIPDPSSSPFILTNRTVLGLFAWRTIGAPSPGGRFSKYRDLAGNTFYTINVA